MFCFYIILECIHSTYYGALFPNTFWAPLALFPNPHLSLTGLISSYAHKKYAHKTYAHKT